MADEQSTLYQESPPAVLLVGVEESVRQACVAAAVAAGALRTEACDVGAMPSLAAALRPFAIVIPETTYEFDPDEFEALAQSVGGETIKIPDRGLSGPKLVDWLVPPLEAALLRARRASLAPNG